MDGCRSHCWLEIYDIHNNPGQVPEWLKAVGPKADQLEWLETMTPKAHRLWNALEGIGDGPVGPILLREFSEDGSILHAMVSDRQNSVENSGPRVRGDRESTMGRKERDPKGGPRHLAKTVLKTAGPESGATASPPWAEPRAGLQKDLVGTTLAAPAALPLRGRADTSHIVGRNHPQQLASKGKCATTPGR